jgi:VWFA-related protein
MLLMTSRWVRAARWSATLVALVFLGGGWPLSVRAQTPQGPPVFRSGTDVIAVDVQVVDKDGRPVTGLGPDQFEVTINGRRRRVVSAALIAAGGSTETSPTGAAPAANTLADPAAERLARTVILAIDCLSLDVAAAREAVEAARTFVRQSPPGDLVGLYAFPLGPTVNPTTDRPAVTLALNSVVGQQEVRLGGEFNLRPSELVDLAVWADSMRLVEAYGRTSELVNSLCSTQDDPSCPLRLAAEVKGQVLTYEGQAYASLGRLRGLFEGLSQLPGRKTVVLISSGVIAGDGPGTRPDLDELSTQIGKAAAQGNVAVYTLFLDRTMETAFRAQTGRPTRDMLNFSRDEAIAGRWLDRFSGIAGGAMMRAVGGNGELELSRIRTEMSAYYLLAVEPTDADRDGRIHPMQIKVDQRGLTVRGRSWVVVPKPGDAPPALSMMGGSGGRSPLAAAPGLMLAPRPLPDSVRGLAAAYAQKDYGRFARDISGIPDLANVIRDYRTADAPWPDTPRRAQAFALELALAGLFSDNGFARDEGLKLLAQAHALVRQSIAPDSFECAWYWAEAAALEGLRQPEAGIFFVDRASMRCPGSARLILAHAVMLDQAWGDSGSPGRSDEVLKAYEDARGFPETALEASLREAWVFFRNGNAGRALGLLGGAPESTPDLQVRYLHFLIEGHVLRGLGRLDAAEAAYRDALAIWPGAQSGRIALMGALVARGAREEAARLADDVLAASTTQVDPWWMYWRGDFRGYPGIVADLREIGG